MTRHVLTAVAFLCLAGQVQRDQVVRVDLSYQAPGTGPAPNFSPYGTQVPLTPIAPGVALPAGAAAPARTGIVKVGPSQTAWVPILVASDADHPKDFSRLFVDRNRNGRFDDDGAAVAATPSQNEKTRAWWSSFDKIEFAVPYGNSITEPYLVNFWAVREDAADVPAVIRYSVRSWRAGTATINGTRALVAVMDGNNDALWTKADSWSVLGADEPNAARAVLTLTEARNTSRFMFVKQTDKELVLEFRSFSEDGRFLTLAVVDRPMTKAADRAPDDMLAAERPRPRTKAPFTWGHSYAEALAAAKASGKRVFIDFETTWCGPCKSMDEWIWTDVDVAAALTAGYVGVKLDGDIEKALVKQYTVAGYPTMVMLDSTGKEIKRLVGYQSSKDLIAALAAAK